MEIEYRPLVPDVDFSLNDPQGLSLIDAQFPGILYRCSVTPDGDIDFSFIGAGLSDLCGIDPDAVTANADAYLSRLHSDHRDGYIESLRNAKVTPSRRIASYSVVMADGSARWIRDIANVEKTEDDTIVWHGILHDDTTWKEREEELLTNGQAVAFAHDRLRKTLEGISDGFVLWNSEDRLVLSNQRFRTFYNEVADRIVPGVGFVDLVGTIAERGLLSPEEGERGQWLQRRIALHRSGGAMGEESLRDGRYLLVRESHLDDGSVVSIYTDITSRKKAEKDLHKLSLAVGQSSAAIVITNTEGIIEYVNPHFTTLTGYNADEAIGQTPRLVKSGRMPQDVYEDLWGTILAGMRWRGELLNRKKNGELYWEDLSISPVVDSRGRISHFVAVSEDVTGRKRSEEALRRSEREIRSILDNMTDVFFRCDLTGRIVMASRSATEITGMQLSQVLSSNFRDLFADAVEARRFFSAMEESGGHLTGFEMALKQGDGSTVLVSTNAQYFHGESGNIAGVEGTMRNITELIEARRQLEQIAHHDPLTGLANRRLVEDHLKMALARIRRSHQLAALLYIDLDGFKNVNDNYGHTYGDRLLEEVARRMIGSVREKDTVARFGGDEFIILLEDISAAADAERIAQKIVDVVKPPFDSGLHDIAIGASIGVVIFGEESIDSERLLIFADRAMYRAKRQGKGTYRVFDPTIDGDSPCRPVHDPA